MVDGFVLAIAGKVMLLTIAFDTMIFNPTHWAGCNLRIVNAADRGRVPPAFTFGLRGGSCLLLVVLGLFFVLLNLRISTFRFTLGC